MESVSSAKWSGPSNDQVSWNKTDQGGYKLGILRPDIKSETLQYKSGDTIPEFTPWSRDESLSSMQIAEKNWKRQQAILNGKPTSDRMMQLANTKDTRQAPDFIMTTGTRPDPENAMVGREWVDTTRPGMKNVAPSQLSDQLLYQTPHPPQIPCYFQQPDDDDTEEERDEKEKGVFMCLQGIWSDLKNWDDVPGETDGEKAQVIFFGPNRGYFWLVLLIVFILVIGIVSFFMWLKKRNAANKK